MVHGFGMAGDPAAAAGLPGAPLATVRQVHGGRVLVVDGGGEAGEADGLVTRRPGLLLGIRTADCAPVLLVGDGVVGAAHAGWRGVAAGVLPAAVAAMGGAVVAVVGPRICGDCYEVGPEVVEAIAAAGVPRRVFARPGRGDRWQADIAAAAARQLRDAGVRRVIAPAWCTFETPALPSWRRDGARAARLVSVIGLRP